MRSAVTTMVGLALFVAGCGSTTNNDNGSSGGTTGEATTGNGATGGSGTGGATSTGGGGSGTGNNYVDAGLVDGTACTADLACASHICGLSGSGNCCSIACGHTNATCAASGCDDKGTCIYPSMAAMGGAAPACGGSCLKGLLDPTFCDTSGNCSVTTNQSFPCPNSFGCDPKGEACNTSCSADSDCATGAFCLNSVCAPRLAAGACVENDGCISQVCDISGQGDCCKAACAATKDPACNATNCDATSAACVFPAGNTCGQNLCTNSQFTVPNDGKCDATGACIDTPVQCPNNLGCNAGGTACNTTCTVRSDCATGYYCSANACVPELPLGACTENPECVSDFCGTNLTTSNANCCAAACAPTADPKCDPINCDAKAGACVYPAGFACGAATCTSNVLTFACDDTGACQPNTAVCGGNLTCNAAGTDCNATCASDTDCVNGYYCYNGACNLRVALGACPINDGCTSGVCGGITGSGHCCTAACSDTDKACGATDCNAKTGACVYPAATTACGAILSSCTNGIEDDPSVCDGKGNCPTPGTSVCSPFICDSTTSACFTSCSDNTSCVTGDFCDQTDSACCSALSTGGTINVDGKTGKDASCCGINGNTACLTISRAMELIDSAQAQGVTISATVNGGGGTWAPKGESYPITLGWGAELTAPGVYFYDSHSVAEIFDVNFYSTNDTLGYASIVGMSYNPVYIGWDQNGDQPAAASSIMVEASNTLYIANATVNGSQNNMTNAITVAAGGTLTLGQDQSAGNTGMVSIGQNNGQSGWNGIVCQTDSKSLGCTITDANLNGSTAVDIQYQQNMDIDAEDFANISLTSYPIVGTATNGTGFGRCNSKPDATSSSSYPNGQAILLNGIATMTFNNGTVQCIAGNGFLLQATKEGVPTLNMDSSTIQNLEYGIEAMAGTATVSNTTIQYVFTGVDQDTDGTNVSTIDLSGGSIGGTNTVACANSFESVDGMGNRGSSGVAVLDNTPAVLNASNVNWDTSGPDTFECTNAALTTCTCEINSCTDSAGADGMDAVYTTAKGTITTTGHGTTSLSCSTAVQCGLSTDYPAACQAGWQCCDSQYDYYPIYADEGCCAPPDGDASCYGEPCCYEYCSD